MTVATLHWPTAPAVARVSIMRATISVPQTLSVASIGLVPPLDRKISATWKPKLNSDQLVLESATTRKKSLSFASSNAFPQQSRTDSVDTGGAA